jgi:hypothetical protein
VAKDLPPFINIGEEFNKCEAQIKIKGGSTGLLSHHYKTQMFSTRGNSKSNFTLNNL